MSKPRTFYTDGDVVRESDSEDIKQLRSGGFDLIEVIEKSAYDALLAQNKLLVEALLLFADEAKWENYCCGCASRNMFLVQYAADAVESDTNMHDLARQALSKVKGEAK